MFGIVTASLSKVTDEEKERYQALYCGLCRSLNERYGQISRATLNYDLTFYIMLVNSLREPTEQTGSARCIAHPNKKMPYAQSIYSDYAADLTVALSYHKLLDDWHDEHSARAKVAQTLLAGAYMRALENIPEQCRAIESALTEINRLETAPDTDPDQVAFVFGMLFGELFAANQGAWSDMMGLFGAQLGRFISLMDSAVDYADDEKTGAYNPFVALQMPPENMKTLLAVLIGDAAETFEKLPLEQDLHLLQSVMYSGVWQMFNKTYPQCADVEDAEADTAEETGTDADTSKTKATECAMGADAAELDAAELDATDAAELDAADANLDVGTYEEEMKRASEGSTDD